MTGNDLTRTRRIDGGEPLFLRNPPHSEETTGYSVSAAVCANPECPCTTMGLRIQEVRRGPDGGLEIQEPHLFGEVSWDGSGLTIDADSEGGTPEGLIAWLQETLGSERNREWLQERWRRSRGQVGDPKYPSGILPEDVEWMVPFCDVFPYEFDLTIVHENHPYLVEDIYCLHPGCGCDAVVVQFFDGSEGGEPIGLARTSARRRKPVEIDGPPLTKHLWDEFLIEFGPSLLRDHFTLMRSAAKPIRLPVRVPEPSVGRNAPCPCGSGKKFKRCCGA